MEELETYIQASMAGIYKGSMADYLALQQALDRKIAEEKAGIASLESQEQSFTKRLQDRRTQQQKILNGGAVDFATGLQSPNGIALDPQKLGNIFNSLVAANLEQTQPYEQDLKDVTAQKVKAQQSTSEFDMLAQMLGLQQEQERIDVSRKTASGAYSVVDPETGAEKEVDSMTAVIMQGGGKMLEAENSVTAKKAKADAIMSMGGVKKYLEQATSNDLFSTAELEKMGKANELMRYAGNIVGATKDKDAPGLGLLGRFRPGWGLGKEGSDVRSDLGQLTAEKMKEISGAAISEQEAERLKEFLPSRWDSDENNIQYKADRLYKGISIGMKMAELAKRNNMTLNEAYVAFADQVYPQYGEEIPAWVSKEKSVSGSSSAGSGTDADDEALINKYKGK